MQRLILIFLLMGAVSVMHAQDMITLKNGDEIKAKVTEISSTEIRYKRFDNLDGPVVVIPKADVFAINYENGTRDVIGAISSTPATTPAVGVAMAANAQRTTVSGPHGNDFYTGIYFNPLGFALAGPMLGAEFTLQRHFIIDAHLRFLSLGALSGVLAEGTFDVYNLSGIGIGIGAKYFTGGSRGGFYIGPVLEYYTQDYNDGSGFWDGEGILYGANLGYKFQFNSGFYMRFGGYLGGFTDWGTYSPDYGFSRDSGGGGAFYSMEFGIGFAF
jgi:hypothetical protein